MGAASRRATAGFGGSSVIWQPLLFETFATQLCAVGVTSNLKTYPTSVLANDLVASARNTILRKVSIEVLPANSDSGVVNPQPLTIQLIWTTIDGTLVVMTRNVALNLNSTTRVGFSLPRELVEARLASDGSALLSVAITNRRQTDSLAVNVVYNIRATFDICGEDAPTLA
jgi:hypothetical protein